MNSPLWGSNTAKRLVLASIGIFSTIAVAHAVPPTLNSSGLTPQQCYRRDSDCTQMCGDVVGDLRYECFGICDRMLDRCLSTGDWSDSLEADPGTGKTPDKRDLLAGLFVRMMMVLTDRDGNSEITPKEIQSLKDSVFEKDTRGKKKTSPRQE